MAPSIRQFGYDLFLKMPSSFVPSANVPVGPDYVVGPGDEIRISVWGKIEGVWSAVVDKDGAISLPKLGTFGVTGLTFKELKEVLRKEISKYYTGFEMNVSMGQLRTMRIYIVGNAAKPGVYNLSSLSTLVSALFEVGGPSKTGSLRDIQLKRNGKKVVHFDLYDFLLMGDKSKDVRLMPEDVLFIPPVGSLAGITGSVKTPAIYELKDTATVSQLIEMAGGLSDVAFTGRLQIQRIIGNGRQTVFESDVAAAKDLPLLAGDVVRIYVAVQDRRFVKITGAVMNAGDYGYHEGMTIRDLISVAGGLQYYAYTKEADIRRVRVTEQGPASDSININIEKALAGDPENNIKLLDNDYLFVRAVPGWGVDKTVTILGEVKFPGTYSIRKDETISSLIARAGGFTPYAYLRGSVFTRESVRLLQQQQLSDMIDKLARDVLSVGVSNVSTATTVDESTMLKMENDQKRAFISKLSTLKAQGRIAIRLPKDIANFKGSFNDIPLTDGDVIQIPSDPKTVQVIGSVYNQSAFIYDSAKNTSDYIGLAGGYTENADDSGTYIIMADGTTAKVANGFLGIEWNSTSSRWDSGGSGIGSGDTIVVPEKLERIPWMRNIKDVTQILYQIAVGAGVMIKLF
jgi:protein involved in polysaccharide export with SLBB domain